MRRTCLAAGGPLARGRGGPYIGLDAFRLRLLQPRYLPSSTPPVPFRARPSDRLNHPTHPLRRRQAPGFVQVNVVGVPRAHAFDFLQFVLRNSRACPLLDICDGHDSPHIASGADLTTDLPKYHVLVDGVLDACPVEVRDAAAMKFFLLGCSFTWEHLLHNSGFPVRHIEEGRNVPMYRTNIPNVGGRTHCTCNTALRFKGIRCVTTLASDSGQQARSAATWS